MLAILGLLGLAVAGTAFVGFPSDTELSDADDSNGTFEKDTEVSEMLSGTNLLDFDEDSSDDDSTLDDTSTNLALETIVSPADDLTGIVDDVVDPLIETVDSIVAQTSDGVDEFFGGDGDDHADGQLGADYLDGRAGDDILSGGGGDDHIHGGAGNDTVSGDDGDDIVYGYIGDDNMSGGLGADRLVAGDGDDHIEGGAGNDELLGGHGNDTLIGGAGNDNLQGSEGDDVLDGVTGEDIAEVDYLNGSEGRDTLIGNNGDVMSGGADADRFEITSGTVSIMDYADDDLLVLNYEGNVPELTTEAMSNGTMLFANGAPVASLYGVTSFDVSTVQLVPS